MPQTTALVGDSTGIINGKPVPKTDSAYKMTARILLEMDGIWYPVCTASILANDLILTAAHCVKDTETANLRIAFDAQPVSYTGQQDPKTRIDILAKFQTVPVDNYIVHPLYEKSDYDQDMALIHLKGAIPEGFKSAPLMTDDQMKQIDTKRKYVVVLAGFGLFGEDPVIDSDVLRKTSVPAQFEGFHVVTDQTLGSGGCNGDSGGPAYLQLGGKLVLVGVTHGPKIDEQDCHHSGVWGNPNFEKSFLNESAQKMGSSARF
jgi:secreted trypsin-like serine protease